MMRRVINLALCWSLLLTLSTMNARAQRTTVVRTDVRQIIRNLETDTDTFKSSLDHALDRSPLDGTKAEDEINEYVKQFEHATDKLKDRAEDQKHSPYLAREVLVRGRAINGFMRRHRLGSDVDNDWVRVRNDLTQLANSYYINWRW